MVDQHAVRGVVDDPERLARSVLLQRPQRRDREPLAPPRLCVAQLHGDHHAFRRVLVELLEENLRTLLGR
eukprot:326893-Heterocapsa_arctica.AAC.1